MLDIEELLTPVSDDAPCGPDLEYDAAFGEMERAAEGKGDQQFGDTVVAAEPPDWKEVRKQVDSLLPRTKDMRVAVYLARCLLHFEGLLGVESALKLLRRYTEDYWGSVHPELDESDNNDPTYRINTLVSLCDESGFLRELQDCPMVSSRAMGQFGLRAIVDAHEEGESSGEESTGGGAWAEEETAQVDAEPSGTTPEVFDAAFTDADAETLVSTEEAVRNAAEHVAAIENWVTEQVGAAQAVSLQSLQSLFTQMAEVMQSQLQRLGIGGEEEEIYVEEDESSDPIGEDVENGSGGVVQQSVRLDGKIATREDAIRALDRVCEYYERNEPSSPLPLLIRRAQRLASKSFLDIIRDLAPDAVSQAEAWGGGAGPIMETGYGDETQTAEEDASSSDSW